MAGQLSNSRQPHSSLSEEEHRPVESVLASSEMKCQIPKRLVKRKYGRMAYPFECEEVIVSCANHLNSSQSRFYRLIQRGLTKNEG